ncbi:MAG: hypothetical protein IJY93_00205 [Clostridia bacterium]|nr:hypothetical protein [Clostridia bacterium]
MKKLITISMLAMTFFCILALGVDAVTSDITDSGLVINDAADAGTYKAGNGTVTVSFEDNICYVVMDNATIETDAEHGFLLDGELKSNAVCESAVVTFKGTNKLTALYYPLENEVPVTYIGEDGSKVILESEEDGIGGYADITIQNCTFEIDAYYDIYMYSSDDYEGTEYTRCDLTVKNSAIIGTYDITTGKLVVENSEIHVSDILVHETINIIDTLKVDGEMYFYEAGYNPTATDPDFWEKVTGSGVVILTVNGSGTEPISQAYDTDGNMIEIIDTLNLGTSDQSGTTYSWNAATKTLTLEDGFVCENDIDFEVDGDITVIVKGIARVGDDFENAYSDDAINMTIMGGGTLYVDGDLEVDTMNELSVLTIAAGTTVITYEEMDVDSLNLYGSLVIDDDTTSIALSVDGDLYIDENASLEIVGHADGAAIAFEYQNSNFNIPGTTLVPFVNGSMTFYALADTNGDLIHWFNSEDYLPRRTSTGFNSFLCILLLNMKQMFTVSLDANEGGSIVGDETVCWSRSAVYTITPDEGFELTALYLDGEEIEPVLTLELNRVKSNHTIKAVFAPIEAEDTETKDAAESATEE